MDPGEALSDMEREGHGAVCGGLVRHDVREVTHAVNGEMYEEGEERDMVGEDESLQAPLRRMIRRLGGRSDS